MGDGDLPAAAQGLPPGDLVAQARAWLMEDPDPVTRCELQRLLDAGDLAALGERFGGRLEFGTAGLRGALGAGPSRMNRAVVTMTAAGLVTYLCARGATSVVIGRDARHGSADFASDTAQVVTGAGLRALTLPRALPTPVLAFAVRHLGADAGVMVTASHNPKQDNGYKVYLGDGRQIVPPADAEISAAIDAVGPLSLVRRGDDGEMLSEAVVEAYLDRVTAVPLSGTPREVSVVYTPLHGVGRDLVLAAFARAGFAAPYVVAEQGAPDPDFPTAPFPNPEEPGAMDLALAAGKARGADLVIANDPDADRCAVAVPLSAGVWRALTGDEVGVLLATHLLRREPDLRGTFACSIVSCSLLGRIAAAHGLGHTQTLTGFKWIARAPGLRFGYEEALGYCVDPGGVLDKDGISAALLVAELAAGLRAEGRTMLDLLDDIEVEHGVHATGQLSVRVSDLGQIAAAMDSLRAAPPTALGGRAVLSAEDLAAGAGNLPPTEGLRYILAGGARVVVRPSGTEPKLKAYLEVTAPVAGAWDLPAARAAAHRDLARIKADLAALVSPAS
jgi:phosphomannomutase